LAAGLCPDPLGELRRSPGPLAAIGGSYFQAEGREGKGKGRGEEGYGIASSLFNFWLRAWLFTIYTQM